MKEHKFLGAVTVGERGQIVIPQEARQDLTIESGEKLLIFSVGHESLMVSKISSFKKLSQHLAKKQDEINKILKKL